MGELTSKAFRPVLRVDSGVGGRGELLDLCVCLWGVCVCVCTYVRTHMQVHHRLLSLQLPGRVMQIH